MSRWSPAARTRPGDRAAALRPPWPRWSWSPKSCALVQRAQPRDLFDLRLYLFESGWHLDPADLRRAVDAKLALTRHHRWRSSLWRLNLEVIERAWDETMGSWVDPSRLPPFTDTIEDAARRLRELRLD